MLARVSGCWAGEDRGKIGKDRAIWPGYRVKMVKKGKSEQKPIKRAINKQKGVVYEQNTSIMLTCRNKPVTQKKGLHYEKIT